MHVFDLPDAIHKNTWAITLSLWLLGVGFAVFNLYVLTQLAPITKDLAVLTTRVDAYEETNTPRLNRIEDKLDRLLEYYKW